MRAMVVPPLRAERAISAARLGASREARGERRHLESGEHRLPALVAIAARRTLERRLRRVDGQHAEGDRHAGLEACVGEAACALAGDIVEVRRVPADDAAEGDDGVVAAALAELARREGQLESSRNARHRELLGRPAALAPCLDRSPQQTRDDGFIEARGDDGDASSAGARLALDQADAGRRRNRGSLAGTGRTARGARLTLHPRRTRLRDRTPTDRAAAWAPTAR